MFLKLETNLEASLVAQMVRTKKPTYIRILNSDLVSVVLSCFQASRQVTVPLKPGPA